MTAKTAAEALAHGLEAAALDASETFEALAKATMTPRGPRWGLDDETAARGAGAMAARARWHRDRVRVD